MALASLAGRKMGKTYGSASFAVLYLKGIVDHNGYPTGTAIPRIGEVFKAGSDVAKMEADGTITVNGRVPKLDSLPNAPRANLHNTFEGGVAAALKGFDNTSSNK